MTLTPMLFKHKDSQFWGFGPTWSFMLQWKLLEDFPSDYIKVVINLECTSESPARLEIVCVQGFPLLNS